jgi:hypothetical protein
VLDHWQDCGATEAMHGELRRQCRIAAGRKPEPSAAVTDSSGPPRPRPLAEQAQVRDGTGANVGVVRAGVASASSPVAVSRVKAAVNSTARESAA